MNVKEKGKRTTISSGFGWYWAIITILLCSVTAFWVGIVPTGNTLDFPISVISAERILSGERPYVDFSVLYGPLGHYLKAMGMAPFRNIFPPAQALQYFTSLVAVGYTVFVVTLARRRLSNCPYMFRFLMLYLIIAMPTIATKGYYSLLEMLLVAFACFAAQKMFREPNTYVYAFFLALITVVLLFSRLNFGIYLVCALCGTLGVQIATRSPHAWGSTRKVLLFLILSVTVITGMLSALGIMHNYSSETIAYLSRFNARHLPLTLLASNSSLFWCPFAAAVGFVALMLAVVVMSALKRSMQGALYISLLGPSFLHYALVRFGAEHMYPLITLLPVFTVIIAEESTSLWSNNQSTSFGGGYRFRRVVTDPCNLLKAGTVVVMVLFALSFNPTPLSIVESTYSYHSKKQVTLLQNSVPIAPLEYMLLKSLWEKDGGIGAVFFGNLPGACESTVHACTNVSLYLAKGQLPKTYFWYFDTPSTPYDDTQQNIIADIDRKKIKWVVLQGLINNNYLPGNPKESKIFFDYVVAKYSPENRFIVPESNATYQIFRRRDIQ